MSKIIGRAKRYDGTSIDYVLLFDWFTGECLGKAVPDAAGNWSYEYYSSLNCGITYVADGCEPITHGAYQFIADDLLFKNNIGLQGSVGFGVGVANTLPTGVSEMIGTQVVGHENYGNYQCADGSIMVYVPRFYYRLGGADSPYASRFGLNSIDVRSMHDFAGVAEANTAGYAVHRVFYDDGQLKDGFFVDKYLCSNNGGVASSLKNAVPMSASALNSPFSGLNGAPQNSSDGAIDAAKTRGASFFVATLFVQKALALLSVAHGQAVTNADNCAWYDPNGVINYPKGCNNSNFGDINDPSVIYIPSGFDKAVKTGSASELAKTTHNGQSSGVADLNGVMYEISLGIACLSGVFYALKTTTKAASLTSSLSSPMGAWGANGIAANYEPLGSSIGAFASSGSSIAIGNGSNRVFSDAVSGAEWQATGAGIPALGGSSSSGSDLFGHDVVYYTKVNGMRPLSGRIWSSGVGAGVWSASFATEADNATQSKGFRAALYL